MFHPLPTLGTLVADKYRIEALLGEGGMGAVFRAHHELMHKRVALKWLQPEFSFDGASRERFLREARAASRIKHPHVVDVFDVGVHEGALFMVMELLEGETFEALLQRGTLSIPRALGLLIGAMRGVEAAHSYGVVHRDVKPDNIFVKRDPNHADGVAKVLDFGISKLADDAPRGRNITRTGAIVGTPAYMSSEQMNGAKDVDARADVYSFGVLLYRTLTGVSPFDGGSAIEVAVKVATLRPATPKQLRPELPVVLDEVVMKAMAFDRADRYPSMSALIADLSTVASTEAYLRVVTLPALTAPKLAPVSDEPSAPRPAPEAQGLLEPPSRDALRARSAGHGRRRTLVWAIGLGLLTLAASTGLRLRSRSREAPVVTAVAGPARVLTPPRAPETAADDRARPATRIPGAVALGAAPRVDAGEPIATETSLATSRKATALAESPTSTASTPAALSRPRRTSSADGKGATVPRKPAAQVSSVAGPPASERSGNSATESATPVPRSGRMHPTDF